MHMADALVSPPVATGMAVASLAVGAYSIFRIKKENKPENIPVMGVMGAFVFATQMVNFTIPGTGSSGHLCGGLLLSALIGPYGGFLSMMAILLLQCLLFADGEYGFLCLFLRIFLHIQTYIKQKSIKEKNINCKYIGKCFKFTAWCI